MDRSRVLAELKMLGSIKIIYENWESGLKLQYLLDSGSLWHRSLWCDKDMGLLNLPWDFVIIIVSYSMTCNFRNCMLMTEGFNSMNCRKIIFRDVLSGSQAYVDSVDDYLYR